MEALVRGLHLSELQAAGAARAVALHQAELELDRVARLLPDALQAGISLAEIARVAGVSRPTLYELRARYGGSVRDTHTCSAMRSRTNWPVTRVLATRNSCSVTRRWRQRRRTSGSRRWTSLRTQSGTSRTPALSERTC